MFSAFKKNSAVLFLITNFLFVIIFLLPLKMPAQRDSAKIKYTTHVFSKADSAHPYAPKVATIRSAILPGWGQATNKKYWKIPIVYAALGITTGILIHNIKQYRTARDAYKLAIDTITANDFQIPEPYFSVRFSPDVIRNFRNQVRQNVDYSALFIIFFWGLNVVDATVDAHLKTFDVGPDLSLQIKPGYSPMANTNGISLVMHIGKK